MPALWLACVLAVVVHAAPGPAEEMMAWDKLAVRLIKQERLPKDRAEEALALVRVAVNDAMNSSTPLAHGLSAEVAGAVAAHRVLTTLWPSRKAALDARLNRSFTLCPDEATAQKAYEIGTTAADAVLESRWKWRSQPRLPAKLPRLVEPALPKRTRFVPSDVKMRDDPLAPKPLKL